MIWKHWMIAEIIEIMDYDGRCKKMDEFIKFMEEEE